MTHPFRLKLALGVFLVLLFGAVSVSRAQTSSPSSITLKSAEEINQFLTEHYTELTTEERDLIQKALQTRLANDGRGNFRFLPPVKQAEVVGKVFEGLLSSLWPRYDQKTQAYFPGVLGQLGNLTDAVINAQPTITPTEMLASLNPAKSSFAQQGAPFLRGTLGTSALINFSGAVGAYWQAFRNFAYAFLTVILVAFGFLIMLRKNIEPRVVMTISNALPRIATALVLITFSFAISGLLIDVGRVADVILSTNPPFTGQGQNHTVFSLLRSFVAANLTNMGASLESPEYVWKFDEDDLDKNHPQWRCDYSPGCPRGPGNGCVDANNQPCEPYYCSLGPFGSGPRLYSCRITFFPKIKIPIINEEVGPVAVDLVHPNEVPEQCLRFPQEIPNSIPNFRGINCCNRNKCHGDLNPWRSPFPRYWYNVLEMWINRLILMLVSAILNLLFFFTLLQTIIALLFKLLTCYAMWFIYTIFSPFVFMWSAIPGQEDTATNWAKGMLANVLAFPVINFVINFALSIAAEYAGPGASPGAYPSMLFIGPNGAVGLLVAFGLIIMTPSIPDVLKDLIGAKGPKGGGAPDVGKQVKKLPIIGGLVG